MWFSLVSNCEFIILTNILLHLIIKTKLKPSSLVEHYHINMVEVKQNDACLWARSKQCVGLKCETIKCVIMKTSP